MSADAHGPGPEAVPLPQAQADVRQPDSTREGWSVGDLLSNADARPMAAPRNGRMRARKHVALSPHRPSRSDPPRACAWTRSRARSTTALRRRSGSVPGRRAGGARPPPLQPRRPGDLRRISRLTIATATSATVDRYIGDFERLLREAEQTDPEGRKLRNYMTSETGRVICSSRMQAGGCASHAGSGAGQALGEPAKAAT